MIFGIYLQLDHGYYLQVEDFEDEPLLLRPFEAFRKRYEPIDLYTTGMSPIKIDQLMEGKRRRGRRLILSTSHGRYIVTDYVREWHPISDFFRNHLTAVITPRRSRFEGKAYGSGTKFVVKFKMANGETDTVGIHEGDYRLKRFREFRLTAESLKSRDALHEYLLSEAIDGRIKCADIEVFDIEYWRGRHYEGVTDGPTIEAAPRSWFAYHVLGWLTTRWSDLQLSLKNRAARRQREREKRKKADGS